ncbi:MAG: LysR family transcriptional regulator [Polyangiales bacterium]
MSDWDAYRVFLAVAERRSFSAAARALGSSQPTVGRAIASLETSLGTRLFLRTPRELVLTPDGERILDDVRRMAEAARDAERRASGGGSAIEGTIRIAVSEGLGGVWLVRRLPELREAHPGLRFELVISNVPVDLARREADLALRLFRPTEPDLVARRVGRLRFGLFASPAYLEAHGSPRKRSDLAKHDLVGFPSRGTMPTIGRWLHRLAPEERFVVTSHSLLAQHEAARAGLGIVSGAEVVLADDPRLRRVLPKLVPPSLEVYLATHVDVRRSPRVSAAYEALAGLIAKSPLRD